MAGYLPDPWHLGCRNSVVKRIFCRKKQFFLFLLIFNDSYMTCRWGYRTPSCGYMQHMIQIVYISKGLERTLLVFEIQLHENCENRAKISENRLFSYLFDARTSRIYICTTRRVLPISFKYDITTTNVQHVEK